MNCILIKNCLIKVNSIIMDTIFLCQYEFVQLTPVCVNFSSKSVFFPNKNVTHTMPRANLPFFFIYNVSDSIFGVREKRFLAPFFCDFYCRRLAKKLYKSTRTLPRLEYTVTKLREPSLRPGSLLQNCRNLSEARPICRKTTRIFPVLGQLVAKLQEPFRRSDGLLQNCENLSGDRTACYKIAGLFPVAGCFVTKLRRLFRYSDSLSQNCIPFSPFPNRNNPNCRPSDEVLAGHRNNSKY